ncbi:hypothetical protein DFO67_1299 [Modicisalibacter xianhensis]|uniref:Ankyrin repeat domain-containing protein n=1 Tax=Modicisalibacter xianhensis TaxID=442341 RepID=A0A4R8FA78_9GAMM|nr:ankyrin repeat domain-containing protein [Halomonas xianhensis]TDX22476.1 hypothetical protein DFO67_1299 [Halomonas xianhensis]
MNKFLTVIAITLLISACASTDTYSHSDPRYLRAKEYYNECMKGSGYYTYQRDCSEYSLAGLDEELKDKAFKHRDNYLEQASNEVKLLWAAMHGNIDEVKKFIAQGINVNAEFSNAQLNGTQGEGSDDSYSLLYLATGSDLGMMELLLQNGADPSWHYGEPLHERDIITDSYDTIYGDTKGVVIGHLLLDYGYKPTASALYKLKSGEGETAELYRRMLAVAEPSSKSSAGFLERLSQLKQAARKYRHARQDEERVRRQLEKSR